MSREIKYIGMDVHKEAIVIAVLRRQPTPLCSYFGIQSPSDFYLASYRVTAAMLLEAVETIAITVKAILSGCQEESQVYAA